MPRPIVLTAGIVTLLIAACSRDANVSPPTQAAAESVAVAARLATAPTFRHSANDAAIWVDPADPSRSVLLVSGGEGGMELNDLSGARIARIESLEAAFIDVRQRVDTGSGTLDLVIASDQRLGAIHVYSFDSASRQLRLITAAPIEVHDAVTGVCTYRSGITGKLYAFIATDQGQLEQWELFFERDRAAGRFVRRIAAGKGVAHCVADDASGTVYFGEESVGIWQVSAEPESDATRKVVDLVEPRGSLHEEVKGLGLYRGNTGTAYLVAADAGNKTFNLYTLAGERAGTFRIASNGSEVSDVEGITAISAPLGETFPRGALVIADEESGDYKLVSWSDIARTLALPDGAAEAGGSPQVAVRTVEPAAETVPADSYGDAADDPAIWVDRSNPSRSVVIGTDKKLGLNVYGLDGKRLQVVPDGRMNNVDLRDGFMLGGKPTTVVAATNRTSKSISLYRLDHATRKLSAVSDGILASGLDDPYGLCMYRSPKTQDFYVLANDATDATLRQWRLVDRGGKIGIEQVRDIKVGSQAEGCAADDEFGDLYVGEEDVALWKYSAEPDGGSTRTAVDTVKAGKLVDDVEGVSIYYGGQGKGFIVVSSQGDDTYAVYRREAGHEFVGKFHVVANEALGIDGASETDGLDVVSAPLGAGFPAGLLVVQDGRNLMPAERQNFKFVSWQAVMDALR